MNMNLEQIEREWVAKPYDPATEAATWDTTADEYVYEEKNNFTDDPFLRFMAERIDLTKDMRSLDVGCGAGAFSVAMAGKVGQADGVDISPRMIEVGNRYLGQAGIGNVKLWTGDWHTEDIVPYEGRYDVVFAHTTPAVNDFATLVKMCRASRKHCLICTTARRTDAVMDEVRRLAGRPSHPFDEHVALTFEALWLMGYDPVVGYATMTWLPVKSVEEALAWFLGRLRSHGPVDDATERDVLGYLRSIAIDGMVHERIETTLVNMHWTVS